MIAKSLCEKVHLNIWDEPLNFIDVISRIQIEELLLEYFPTILFVEHDNEFCGECGSFYGSKVWHSTSKYRRVILQCNAKFKNDEKCSTPHLYEDNLKQAFLEAFNSLLENKAEILQGYEAIIQFLTDTSKIDKESVKMQSEIKVVTELLQKCVEENAHSDLDQAEYEKWYKALAERYENIKKGLEEIKDKCLEKNAKRERTVDFIKELEQRDVLVAQFDDELWLGTVEKVIMNMEERITSVFKDGMELEWSIYSKNRIPVQ